MAFALATAATAATESGGTRLTNSVSSLGAPGILPIKSDGSQSKACARASKWPCVYLFVPFSSLLIVDFGKPDRSATTSWVNPR